MGGKAQEKFAQRCVGCSNPGDIQGHAGPVSEQPDLGVGVPFHCRVVGLEDLWKSFPTQTIF